MLKTLQVLVRKQDLEPKQQNLLWGLVMGWTVFFKIHMFKSSSSVPQRATLFGDSIFRDAIKLK